MDAQILSIIPVTLSDGREVFSAYLPDITQMIFDEIEASVFDYTAAIIDFSEFRLRLKNATRNNPDLDLLTLLGYVGLSQETVDRLDVWPIDLGGSI